jgi:Protein of unknown function (DUF2877)
VLESRTEAWRPQGSAVTLRASRLSAELGPRIDRFEGTITGIYRAAIHVSPAAHDDLLTLAVADVGGLPGGILVEGIDDFRVLGLSPGLTVEGRRDRIAIGNGRVMVDATLAARWSPRLPPTTLLPPERTDAAMLEFAQRAAARRATDHGLGPLLKPRRAGRSRIASSAGSADLTRAAEAALVDLLAAIDRRDGPASVLGIRSLVGLGVGLTPSGDDALVGLLAALEATNHPGLSWLSAGVIEVLRDPNRTTFVSEICLRRAARGEFPERIHDLLAAIGGTSPSLVEWSIARAMGYGATSGADMLVGLFGGVRFGMGR